MNKISQGALAAVTAGVLLLGGAGTFAYWSDSGTANGGSFQSGTLALSDGTCDAGWVYANGSSSGDPVTLVVPGDAIVKNCTFTVTATGDHLTADLTAPSSVTYTTSTSAPSLTLAVSALYFVDLNPVTTITAANDGDEVTAAITVTFPFGTAETDPTPVNINDTQALTTTLDSITVTLTQTQASGANPN